METRVTKLLTTHLNHSSFQDIQARDQEISNTIILDEALELIRTHSAYTIETPETSYYKNLRTSAIYGRLETIVLFMSSINDTYYTNTHTHTHAQTHTNTQIHTHTHTHTYTHTYTHTHTQTHRHTHTYTHMHTHTHTHIHTQAHAHTRTHVHTHTCMHAHTVYIYLFIYAYNALFAK